MFSYEELRSIMLLHCEFLLDVQRNSGGVRPKLDHSEIVQESPSTSHHTPHHTPHHQGIHSQPPRGGGVSMCQAPVGAE